jgi:hypothetical protein
MDWRVIVFLLGITIIISIVAGIIERKKVEQYKSVNTRPVRQVGRRKKNQLSTEEKVALLPVKIGLGVGGALIKGLLRAGKKR